jgi:hypothetical protein
MCLLVKQPASTSFTDDFLADVYSKNSDGFGVMYAEAGKVHVFKCLPTNAQEFIDFYRAHADGKDCVWHARMQTHGDIDMDNCHPYRVTDTIWMAHNGILSTGNASDTTRSDTWHFIRNILAPALTANPDLLLDEQFQKFIGSMIGNSNKFGFVRADGEIVIINEKAGVEFVGAWLSNTYAWSTTKFGFQTAYSQGSSGYRYGQSTSDWWAGRGYYDSDIWFQPEEKEEAKGFGKVGKSYYSGSYQPESLSAAQVKPMIKAAFNCWTRKGRAGIEQWIFDAPHKAAAVINYWYDDVPDIDQLINDDPEEAAVWIEDLFRTDSVTPSMLT